jgi:hypothetical protein
VGDDHVHLFSMTMTPDEMTSRYRNRVWSAMWRLPDAVWRRGADAVEEALNAHYPDPHQPLDIPCSFHLRIYTPPQ